MKPKKPHKADEAAQVASATSFRVVFLKGPMDRFVEDVFTERQARALARKWNRLHGANGRRACIYAVTEGRAYPLPEQETRR